MGKVIRNDPTPPVDVEFDQYQRYAFLRRITLAAYSERAAAREPITILDVGSGPERLTERFLGAGFAVTRCDVESFGQDDIVVIPAGGPLPFGDEAFEAVVALEVLEHVRPEARRRLVEECLRIARDLAVFSCPDNRPEVIEAERRLSAAFELLTGHEHPFLAEHAEWGLPTEESVRQLIHDAGVVPLVIGNSPLDRWQAFLMLDQVLRTLDRGPEIATGMYRRANESWPGCCARNPYRRFYVAPKSTRVASAVGAAIAEENGDTTPELVDPLFQLARIAAAELSAREVAHMHARAELLDAAHRRKIEAQRAEELAQTIQGLRDEAAGLKREAAAAGDRAAEAEASTRLLTGQLEVLASTLTAAAGVDRAPRSRLASTVRQLTQRAWTNHPYAADESASVTNVRSATHSLWCFAGRGSLRLRTTLEPGTYRIHCRALASLPTELDVRIGARRLRASMPQHEAKPVSTDVSLESMAEDVEISLDPVVPASVLADLQILRRVDEPLTTAVRRNAIALARRRRTLLRLAQTRIGRSLTVRLRPPPPPLPPESSDYERWVQQRVVERAMSYPRPREQPTLSLLTTVWNTPVAYLETLGESVLSQSYRDFEWILLDNGSTDPEVISSCARFGRDDRVRLDRLEQNLGIIGGVRRCLERASGHYVLPVDSDDFLYSDALQVVASALSSAGLPPLAYSDEDKLFGERFVDAYLKTDWDPVLFLNSCYIAHLCAIDRARALALGVYIDEAAEGCHDWDTFIRFMLAGEVPLHIDEVLYSWRMHPESAALNIGSKSYLDSSHVHVLQKFLDSRPRPDLYRIERSPLWGPTPDWWFRRRHVEPRAITTVRLASTGNGCRSPQGSQDTVIALDEPASSLRRLAECEASGTLLHLVWDKVDVEDDEGTWDALALFELHPDTVMVGGRVLDRDRRIVAAGDYFGFGGECGCPDLGRSESDPGYFGQMWKQRTVSAVPSMLAVVEPEFLVDALEQLEQTRVSLAFLGAWLGAVAATEQRRVVFTPFLVGRTTATRREWDAFVGATERTAFLDRFEPEVVPETRYLSRSLSLDPASPYAPATRDERERALRRSGTVPSARAESLPVRRC